MNIFCICYIKLSLHLNVTKNKSGTLIKVKLNLNKKWSNSSCGGLKTICAAVELLKYQWRTGSKLNACSPDHYFTATSITITQYDRLKCSLSDERLRSIEWPRLMHGALASAYTWIETKHKCCSLKAQARHINTTDLTVGVGSVARLDYD